MTRRKFVPSVDGLEARNLLTNSGVSLVTFANVHEFFLPNLDTTLTAVTAAGATSVDVKSTTGEDVFILATTDFLAVFGGSGSNTIDASLAVNNSLLIGGSHDNSIFGGSGYTSEVSIGLGANQLHAGSTFSYLLAQSSGSTEMTGAGFWTSYAANNGVTIIHANAMNNVVTDTRYAVATLIIADANDPLTVYSYKAEGDPSEVIVPNQKTTVHRRT